jgi:multidrug efflux pump
MNLSDISIRRPVFAAVISLLLVVLGVMSFSRLTLRELPAIDPPIVSVEVNYPGASAAVVETRITQVLEDALAGIEGVETVESSSRNGSADVSMEFKLSRDIEAATNDVRDAVSRVQDRLPEEADPPEISKVESDSDAIVWLNMRSDRMDSLELSDYAERYVSDRLSAIEGVARVIVGGGQRYAMRIWLDREALAARGLAVSDIEAALRRENVELPAGRIESENRDFTLRVQRNYRKAEDFAKLALAKGSDGYVVRLGDVAKVERAAEERRSYLRSNGQPNVGLGIVKTSTANSLDVARAARAEAERVQQSLPEGTEIFVAYDSTLFIESAVQRVYATLIEGGILVVLVIFLFLGSARSALIPAVTVPVCLIAAFIGLYAFGYSINLLTLLALVLRIGLVVDDAIVVPRKHPASRRSGRTSADCRQARHAPGGVRGDRHDRRPRRRVPAHRLHGRQYRTPVPRALGDPGRCRRAVGVRGPDPDPDDGLQAGAAACAQIGFQQFRACAARTADRAVPAWRRAQQRQAGHLHPRPAGGFRRQCRAPAIRAFRTGADRGSRRAACLGHRAGRSRL